tara:strand:- start:473 stop:1048 length:576 start_codon:yes stop_codon:yes gene_type:complete
MNSNKLFLIILGFISAFLILPKIKPVAGALILVTIIIGYGITKDLILAICVGFILGNIFVSLNVGALNKKQLNIEGFKNKKSKKKKRKKEKFTDKNDDIVDNNENFSNDDEEEYFIDSKGSFMDNYKSLGPEQIKGLNKDTQSLIKTQKQLIETLKNMGPALKDGKEILDTFKNYFGKDDDMTKMLSNFKA